MSNTSKSSTIQRKKSTVAPVKAAEKATKSGRITRADQAWNAAHLEYIERAGWSNRVQDLGEAWEQAHADKAEIDGRFSIQRVEDIEMAWDFAKLENAARLYSYWEACEENREREGLTVDQAHEQAIGENARRIMGPDWGKDQPSNVFPITAPPAGEGSTVGPVIGNPDRVTLPLKLLAAALVTAAKDDVRHYLNGVYVHAVNGDLRICSTDGHRLTVSREDLPGPVPAWLEAGVIIPRGQLAEVLPLLARNGSAVYNAKYDKLDGLVDIEFGVGRPEVVLHAANGFASFKLRPVDGTFPNYLRVIEAQAVTLSRGDDQALQAAAINTQYLRSVADVAAKVGGKSVHSFVPGNQEGAAFFTFEGAPNTMMIVMAVRGGEAMPDGVAKIVGAQALSRSIAALKAHATRIAQLLESPNHINQRAELEKRKEAFDDRIARLLAATGSGPKQITQQAAA